MYVDNVKGHLHRTEEMLPFMIASLIIDCNHMDDLRDREVAKIKVKTCEDRSSVSRKNKTIPADK